MSILPYGSEGCNCTQYLAGNWDSTHCPIHGAQVVSGLGAPDVDGEIMRIGEFSYRAWLEGRLDTLRYQFARFVADWISP